jgi:hypothetical protein
MSFSTDYLNIGTVKTLRLPANGTVCPRCGFEYGMDVMKCVYSGQGMSGPVQ